jgi:hypothetical protein
MYGYSSWREFWSRLKNRVDLLIVIATVIHEISYVKNSQYHIHLFFFSVLRTYRISYLFPGVLQLMVSQKRRLKFYSKTLTLPLLV